MEVSLNPPETDEGVLTISAVRDISRRQKAEQKFRNLLEGAPDAMVIGHRTSVWKAISPDKLPGGVPAG